MRVIDCPVTVGGGDLVRKKVRFLCKHINFSLDWIFALRLTETKGRGDVTSSGEPLARTMDVRKDAACAQRHSKEPVSEHVQLGFRLFEELCTVILQHDSMSDVDLKQTQRVWLQDNRRIFPRWGTNQLDVQLKSQSIKVNLFVPKGRLGCAAGTLMTHGYI